MIGLILTYKYGQAFWNHNQDSFQKAIIFHKIVIWIVQNFVLLRKFLPVVESGISKRLRTVTTWESLTDWKNVPQDDTYLQNFDEFSRLMMVIFSHIEMLS